MNFSTKFFIAALATTAAFPVLAQRLPVGGSSTNKKAPDGALPQENASTTTTTTAATSTDGKKYVYSKEAGKAIMELQTAVNAKDPAVIAVKLAAAQSVAKSNDEKFLVASQQTRAPAERSSELADHGS